MSRFSHYDTDEERLPEGMTRVGYDADTQVYTFQDADGSYWESAPGCQYGQLTRVGDGPAYDDDDDGDDDAHPFLVSDDNDRQQQHSSLSWRHEMMPLLNFGVLIGLSLLLLFWYLHWTASSEQEKAQVRCGVDSEAYKVKVGDTCWAIADSRGITVPDLLERNVGAVCSPLAVGSMLCLPK
ncbi:peptidoglycan-binding LysM domain-containingprotein [Purpureocillium lavendulum]|uniref:Peptidoglycan-binding LysM domain-containingprotein n=1 Tax=Purpureocillium lavendulum TaxID=1247861 RepID=A0AB34FHE1_9HYPO|nr:peptidoglycan-binding LysM domain-containingprotein [Purpureocillium lavendulum]